jgi:hypothetical protein
VNHILVQNTSSLDHGVGFGPSVCLPVSSRSSFFATVALMSAIAFLQCCNGPRVREEI